MIMHFLYRLGRFLALRAPLKISYAFAVFVADIYYVLYSSEREAIIANLKVVFKDKAEDARNIARDVFRNFAKYLVDFLRFSKIDNEFIDSHVEIRGRENLEAALKRGQGAIMLSAHMGNWELGGFIISKIGYSISAVVMTHRQKKINDFFINQRGLGNLKSIEIGASLRNCFTALKANELLALLADRDFSQHGIVADFFGAPAVMPRGPAALSLRTKAAIVPAFFLRKPGDDFVLEIEEAILPENTGSEEESVRSLMGRYIPVLEKYISRYPGQWYVFKELWNKK